MYIIIPGIPIPQQRPRMYKVRNKVLCYDPNARDKYEVRALLLSYLKEHYPEFTKFNYPRVSFVFHMPIPKNFSLKKKEEAKKGYVKHLKKPDYDNLEKFYLDCMTGVLYDDDSYASGGLSIKLYHEYPKVIIHIEETAEILQKWEYDHLIYNPDGNYSSASISLCKKTCSLCGCESLEQKPPFPTPSNGDSALEDISIRDFFAQLDQVQESLSASPKA